MIKELTPAIRIICPDNFKIYKDFSSNRLVIQNNELKRYIDYFDLEFYYRDNPKKIGDIVLEAVRSLTLNLKKFNWPWIPDWKKRKDILFRKFNG